MPARRPTAQPVHPSPWPVKANASAPAAAASTSPSSVAPRPRVATPRPTPLLPILALMNGSALLALTVLVIRPTAFQVLQQMMLLLAMWLMINLLVVVLVRLIDSGRPGAASVSVGDDQAKVSVTVGETAPRK